MTDALAVTIRTAIPADAPALCELLHRMWAETDYRELPWDGAKAQATLALWIRHDDVLMLVAERGGKLVGIFGGHIDDWFFSPATTAADIVVYVAPEARASTACAQLVDAFKDWALERNASEIVIATTSGYEHERFGRFLERKGFKPGGAIYRIREPGGIRNAKPLTLDDVGEIAGKLRDDPGIDHVL